MSRTETETSYLADLSMATNLDALRLQSILHTFLQAFNYPVMLKIAGQPVLTGIISFGLA